MGWTWLGEVDHPWIWTRGFSRSLKLRSRYKLGEDRPSLSASAELSPKKLPEAAGGWWGRHLHLCILVPSCSDVSEIDMKIILKIIRHNDSKLKTWSVSEHYRYEESTCTNLVHCLWSTAGESQGIGYLWWQWQRVQLLESDGRRSEAWNILELLSLLHWLMHFSGLLSTLHNRLESQIDSVWIPGSSHGQ